MSTNTALDDIKARAEGHTEGPWEAITSGPAFGDHWYVCASDEAIAHVSANDGVDEEQRRPNAELIASAPKLLAALEAVQALHRKVPVYMTEAGDCQHGEHCEGVEVDGESMCPDEFEGHTCEHCTEFNPDEYPDYPCPTITAIQDALS